MKRRGAVKDGSAVKRAGRRERRAAKGHRPPRLAPDRRLEAVGVALVTFGFLVTALVWFGIRDATNVAYQLPIITSGGLVAVGCFLVGGLLLVTGIVMTRFARQEARLRAGTSDS